jgi:hypothetical protein
MITLRKYEPLIKALDLLASDNGMLMQANIQVPQRWLEQVETASKQAEYLDAKTVGVFIDVKRYNGEVDDGENALEYMVNGEQTVVDMLVKEARVQTLHEVLNSAFDGELHERIFITRRRQHHAR